MSDTLKILNQFFLLLLLTGTTACSSLGYYAQAIQGQLEILQKSKPIDLLLIENLLPQELLAKLDQARQLREFAIAELDLPDNGSYRQYADLERKYVVWNVFAAPELSLEGKHWCYLMVGCLSYRGYFSRDRAIQLANELEQQGYDVYVGGVIAYSTLGWLADPVLNTMLYRDITDLARVIFHELAHQKIYIKGDTEFNEAFADTVAIAGVEHWLLKTGDTDLTIKFKQKQEREDTFINLVLHYRRKLDEIYRSQLSDPEKRITKVNVLRQMVNDYRERRIAWSDDITYDSWFTLGINNAKLNAVTTYRKYLSGFTNLLQSVENNLVSFYKLVEDLGKCPAEKRKTILESGTTRFSC
jgi:predicted aminopeptidase